MVRPSTLLSFEPEFGPNKTGHPARFPLQLPTFFIKLLTQPGQLVFDPFAGTCTTAVAAECSVNVGSSVRQSQSTLPAFLNELSHFGKERGVALPTVDEVVESVAAAPSWDARIAVIRRIPETFGTGQQAAVYSAIASRIYSPSIEPDFAYVHWRDDYELAPIEDAYRKAYSATAGFTAVTRHALQQAIISHPESLRVFRLLLGLIVAEFAEACSMIADQFQLTPVGKGTIKSIESGRRCTDKRAITCATVIDLAMSGELFPPAPAETNLCR